MGFFNQSYLKQVWKTSCKQDRLKNPYIHWQVFKTRPHNDGFEKPVYIRTVFFKPVDASTGEKIQHIQVKFTCGVFKKPVGFWTG